MNGVALQGSDVLSRAERINSLIIGWQIKVGSHSEGIVQEIVKNLAVNPYCTVKKTAENLNIAFTTAQRAIKKLEGLGILTQTSKGQRDRIYCAIPILTILEEPTRMTENFVIE